MCITHEDVKTLDIGMFSLWEDEGEVFINMLVSYMSQDDKEDFIKWYCRQFDYDFNSFMDYCKYCF